MRRIERFKLFADLFQYKTICDEKGNEYVLFADNEINSIANVQDRTAFEAFENHVHLICNIQKDEFKKSLEIAEKIGPALLNNLHICYPGKRFFVYVSCQRKGDMIIRFHQMWRNETPYYNPSDFASEGEKVYMFTNITGNGSVCNEG